MARFVSVVAILLLFFHGGFSQDQSSSIPRVIQKDPAAIAVIQKAMAAMGGSSAVATYQDSEAYGLLTLYSGGKTTKYPITLKSKGTQETRSEVGMSTGTNVRIFNHGQAVIQKPDGRVVKLSENNTLTERVNHIPLLSILSQYQDSNVNLQYQQSTLVGSRECDVVAVGFILTPDSNLPTLQTLFFVNRATGIVQKIQYMDIAENDANSTQKVEVYLDDYRSVDGILVPFHQSFYTDGILDSEIILSSLFFNVGLTEDQFALPAGGTNVQ